MKFHENHTSWDTADSIRHSEADRRKEFMNVSVVCVNFANGPKITVERKTAKDCPNCPGVDSASNRNEYREYFLGGKGGRCVGLTTLPP